MGLSHSCGILNFVFLQSTVERGKHYLYYSGQETNVPTDSQRDTILFSQAAYYANILEKVVHDKDVNQCLKTCGGR